MCVYVCLCYLPDPAAGAGLFSTPSKGGRGRDAGAERTVSALDLAVPEQSPAAHMKAAGGKAGSASALKRRAQRHQEI
jgi:hypothetical protein